jgi:hypothetical protein
LVLSRDRGPLFLAAARSTLCRLVLGLLRARCNCLGSLVLGINSSFLRLLSSLLDVLLARGGWATETHKCNEEGDGQHDDTTNGAGNVGHEADGLDGILHRNRQEEVKFLLHVSDWVVLEAEVIGRLGDVGWLRLGLSLLFLLDGALDGIGLLAERSSVFFGVTNVDVVEQDIGLHRPDLEANGAHRLEVGGGLVFEEIRVGDHAGSPRTFVGRVVDVGGCPFAFVGRVLLHGSLPGTAAGTFLALGVGNLRWDPIAILFIVPVLRLFGLRVGNGGGLVLEPVGWLLSVLVNDLIWCILVPVLGLGSLGVCNASFINPVFWLLVIRIADLSRRVESRVEVLEQAPVLGGFVVDEDFEGVVGANDQSVERGELGDLGGGRTLEVLLLVLAGLGVLVVDDEVYL